MNFKVTYSHRNPAYWEITREDGRWWSVACRLDERGILHTTITNGKGVLLNPHGPTGQKLLNAVHEYERAITHRAPTV